MANSDWAVLPVFLPLLGAALVQAAKAFASVRAARVLEYLGAFAGLALPWLALVMLAPDLLRGGAVTFVIGGWPGLAGIAYRFDGLAWLVNALGFSVAGAAWVYSLGSGPRGPAFTSVFLIQAAALAATAGCDDVFNLFVCLEMLGMASYLLVASSRKPEACLAAFSYLMVSAATMVFFLFGVYGLYRLTGSLSYEGIALALRARPDGGGAATVSSIAAISAAVALRAAVMPLHGWLPDAHAMAPHAVSALLSGVLIKTPLFALSRFLVAMPMGASVGEMLGYAGALTAVGGVVMALSQKDAKRLLAYHSISQIGYVAAAWGAGVAALGRGDERGNLLLAAAFLHAFYHALFKGLLFLAVGTATDAAGTRDVYELRGAGAGLRAAGERLPVTLAAFIIGVLAICAVPPLNGYASKAAIGSVLKGSWEGILLAAASVGTIASFLKLSRIFWLAKRAGAEADGRVRQTRAFASTRSMRLAESFLAALCLAGGLAYAPISAFVGRLIGVAHGGPVPGYLYEPAYLARTALTALAGGALFAMAATKPGKRLARAVRERPRTFHGLFVAFGFGVAGLALLTAYLRP